MKKKKKKHLSILYLLFPIDYKFVKDSAVEMKFSEICIDPKVNCFAKFEGRGKRTLLYFFLKEAQIGSYEIVWLKWNKVI